MDQGTTSLTMTATTRRRFLRDAAVVALQVAALTNLAQAGVPARVDQTGAFHAEVEVTVHLLDVPTDKRVPL